MPYISKELKDGLDVGLPATSAGQLNYLITQECINYLRRKGLDYQGINDVLGALEGAKQEFYRRVVVPYESEKIGINGDVYPGWVTSNPLHKEWTKRI